MEKYFETAPMENFNLAPFRWLALGAAAGEILFTVAWFILGFISPGFTIFGTEIKPYSAIAAPISGLGLGLTAPFMNAAFIVSAIFIFLGVIGIFWSVQGISTRGRWFCLILFALSAIGTAMDGFFTLESFMPHMAGFLLAIGSLIIGFLAAGILFRVIPAWRRFGNGLLLASPLTLMLLVVSLMTFNQDQVAAGFGIAGLTERLLCLFVGAWLTALAWKAFRLS
jgi:hypothetical protein